MRAPPSLVTFSRYPVTVVTAALALLITLAWWQGKDISFLFMSYHIRDGEIWRPVTSIFPHVDLLHLLFNLYWLWVFGTLVEAEFGHAATALIFLLLAVFSSLAEYAVAIGGVGLSGVGYGLFGLLWMLSWKDRRFAGAIDQRTILLFVGWFFLCIVLTHVGAWQVGNIAHAAGAILGLLLGLCIVARNWIRYVATAATTLLVIAVILASGALRPYLNHSAGAGDETAYLGYVALQKEDNKRALGLLQEALMYDERNPDWWYNYGIACQRLRKDREASKAFTLASQLNPKSETFRKTRDEWNAYLNQQP
jgi:membrane associated rhomboid family serine protease